MDRDGSFDVQWIFEHVRIDIEAQLEKIQQQIDRRFLAMEGSAVARREVVSVQAKEAAVRISEQIEAVRRELILVQTAAERAVNKSEVTYEKRFEGINEWRGQSADRERSSAEERAKLQAQFLPREVFETWKATIDRQLAFGEGEVAGKSGVRQRVHDVGALTLAAVSASAGVVGVILTILLLIATHSIK